MAVADLVAAPHAIGEPVVPAPREAVVQLGEERERLGREDLVVALAMRPATSIAGVRSDRCRSVWVVIVVGGEPVSVMVMALSCLCEWLVRHPCPEYLGMRRLNRRFRDMKRGCGT